ncbi:MAG TPA: glutathione S-transferase family protein [Pararhizobium sp.]|nr:glutathione S-transferase family protein [Pararhizobium sp.]
MKLYYAETINPRKACAAARYLGSPVEFVRVDLAHGEHTKPKFAALNPNRKVPLLDADGKMIWEACAIMCFLARAAKSDLWPDDERQVDVIRWLSWEARHFLPYAGVFYFEHIIKPMFHIGPADEAAIEKAKPDFRRFAAVLNDHLKGRRYLVGDGLTIADVAVGATLPYAEESHMPIGEFPEIVRWHDRLNELDAWREPFPATRAAA